MGFDGEVWRLVRQEELLGEVVVDEADFPWLHGRFVPTPAFDEVKPWFDESLSLVEAEEFERFDEVYDRIAHTLSLVAPSGPVAEFLLHIEDGRAWFRWSDEPSRTTEPPGGAAGPAGHEGGVALPGVPSNRVNPPWGGSCSSWNPATGSRRWSSPTSTAWSPATGPRAA